MAGEVCEINDPRLLGNDDVSYGVGWSVFGLDLGIDRLARTSFAANREFPVAAGGRIGSVF
jgi:hypothetical protein